MASTSASIEIAATAERVWQMIGGFNSLPDWLPYIAGSELSEGGRVRSLKTPEGEIIIERLESFSQQDRSYSYSILQAPFPATHYLSTLQVREIAEGQASLVVWSGSFVPAGVSDAEISNMFHGIYRDGLQALKLRLLEKN
ncbi:SRPBCC family protein [Massilia sp. RP-1-19]|uniref:SRPBCC family protein n=1 Tax=Massilia polaris TaxID=2728846 RepID=A0A848HHZ3_9BURK|nr:SRPBCC family protein [Massilia polaris]NML60677.1 SRPBCC family protein [Massilia polaris]